MKTTTIADAKNHVSNLIHQKNAGVCTSPQPTEYETGWNDEQLKTIRRKAKGASFYGTIKLFAGYHYSLGTRKETAQ